MHVIGDSHNRLFFSHTNRTDPLATVHEVMGSVECIDDLGCTYAGMTMGGFDLNENTEEERGFLKHLRWYLDDRRFQNIGLSWGEVDVRWFVIREVKRGETLTGVLTRRLGAYTRFVRSEIKPKVDGKIVMLGAIPYSRRYSEAVAQGDGTLNLIARRLDELMGEVCQANRWYHLSIFDDVLTEDGFLDEKWLSHDENPCTMHLEPQVIHPLIASKLDRIYK
jgi:hypothetical protein